jgi:hypothetical protein
MVIGLFQPELATGALLTWIFGRVFYTVSIAPLACSRGVGGGRGG